MNKETRKVISSIFFWLLILVIFVYLMFPFYWALISALKPEAELIRTPTTYYPHNPTFQNFQAVLQSGDFEPCEEVQRSVWGGDDLEVVAASHLSAAVHAGDLVTSHVLMSGPTKVSQHG